MQVDTNSIYTGILEISLWFYDPDATLASDVEDIVVCLFDNKYIYGNVVGDCRLYHKKEGRVTANINRLLSNPGINDYDAVNKVVIWDMRWIAKNRVAKKIFP